MKADNTTSLIIVLIGTKDIENNGHIVRFSDNVNLDFLYKQIAEKLSILGSYQDIQLYNDKNELLTNLDQIKEQKLVFVDVKQHLQVDIPGPKGLPFVGALYELLPDLMQGWVNQFNKYGPLVKFYIMGRQVIGTNNPDIAALFVKESDYFTKRIGTSGGLLEVKAIGGQGLFTTDTDEMDWKLAHKLLMPAFSPRAIKVYQKEMGIITQQAIKVLEQYKPDEPVEILDWATNITFETIGRIGFGYDFNLLNDRDQPPNDFIDAMGYCLNGALKRMLQAQFMKKLPLESNRKFDRCVKLMHGVVDEVIAQRKSSPDAFDMDKDLLGYMLNARDDHQLSLSDENIRDQVVTFLIAGHDTTANTIAWCLYQLSRNPDIQAKVLQEIADNHITWKELPSSEQINNLKYLNQAIKETLRLYAPLRALTKICKADCIVPGGYSIKAGEQVTIQLHALHHNPETYPDPYRFDPDRWDPEEEQKRSRFAWLPFSTGPRGCIGMAFALQEAKTVLAMLLNRFDFRYDGPDVKIHPKMATTKPMDLMMTIHPRENFPQPSSDTTPKNTQPKTNTVAPTIPTSVATPDIELPPITFLYGTQTGTAQDYANQLAKQAKNFGFKNTTLCDMDSWKVLHGDKSDNELVIICTATYNGQPPDSADKFNRFLDFKMNEQGHENLLKGLSFAVFGLGNKNWRTYQNFPRKVADCLEDFGATRFFSSGEGDADQDMDAEFNEWCAHFWTYTLDHYKIAAASESKSVVPVAASTLDMGSVKVKFIPPTDQEAWKLGTSNCNGEFNATLHVNYELQTKGSPRSTRHIEIDISKLPPVGETTLYNVGDHFEVMPENSQEDVESIALGFGLVLDSVFEIDQDTVSDVSPRSLAANIKGPCSVRNMLTYYADITSPPSRAILGYFSSQLKSISPETAQTFKNLLMPDEKNKDQYPEFVRKHRTLLDLQKAFPQVTRLDLGQFLATVSIIQPRRYSIASSPLVDPTSAHLAVSVVDDIVGDVRYPGLSSSFLKRSLEGTQLRASLKSSKDTFSLQDPTTPIIMVSAGTGFAPFRGFLQERRAQLDAGNQVGGAVLFFGCRRRDQDYIYEEEIEEYEESGILTHVYTAFSRDTEQSPKKYVQHQLLAQAADVWSMVCPTDFGVKPASIYVCGSGAMSNDVRLTFCSMAISFGAASNDKEASDFVDKLIEDRRYFCDVWG